MAGVDEVFMAAGVRSAVILPVSITFFQRANSAAWKAVNCSGVLPTISKPRSSSLGLTAGSFRPATMASCSLPLMSAGRPLGAAKACQE